MSAKTDEKRMEYAKRISDALGSGLVKWQVAPTVYAAPENAVSGRRYKGLNALYLQQKASDCGFVQSRWLTLKDANEQGGKVKADEKGVSLEYWGQRGDKTGIHSYSVFNTAQLEFYQKPEASSLAPEADFKKAAAILKKNGGNVPQCRGEDSPYVVEEFFQNELLKTVIDAGKRTPLFNDVHTQELKDMRVSLACTFLSWETQIPVIHTAAREMVQSWGKSIQHNPSELFKAIRDADKLVSEMVKGLELEQEQLKPTERATERGTVSQTTTVPEDRKSKAVVPKIGDRVTFSPKRSGDSEKAIPSVTGEVISVDDFKGTVTLKCGDKSLPVFRGKGMFFEALPLEHEATKEYAQSLAQKHVGESGKVFFARKEGVYKGVIVETTPTYAVQEVNKGMAILHRLKDLGQDNVAQIQKGRNVIIQKETERVTVAPNSPQQKKKEQGVER